jgi:hypothetical protein
MTVYVAPDRPKPQHWMYTYRDEGAAAFWSGEPCPYDPPSRAGDVIRRNLWTQGHEEELLDATIAALV